MYDICGTLPFLLCLKDVDMTGQSRGFIIFISLLRLVRMVSCWRGLQLFGKAEIIWRSYYLQLFKALFCMFFLTHVLAC